jgi:hypothetical protein
MTITVETYLVVALAFAVFAAVTALGSSLVLGIGFERLRAGFEIIKSQTGFFSSAIHGLDKRMDAVEKQGSYFFSSIHKLEQQVADKDGGAPELTEAPKFISARKSAERAHKIETPLWAENAPEEVRFH